MRWSGESDDYVLRREWISFALLASSVRLIIYSTYS
jgi:hypothetical protein